MTEICMFTNCHQDSNRGDSKVKVRPCLILNRIILDCEKHEAQKKCVRTLMCVKNITKTLISISQTNCSERQSNK